MEEITRAEPVKDLREIFISPEDEAPGIQLLSSMMINGTLISYMAAPVPPPPSALTALRKKEREA